MFLCWNLDACQINFVLFNIFDDILTVRFTLKSKHILNRIFSLSKVLLKSWQLFYAEIFFIEVCIVQKRVAEILTYLKWILFPIKNFCWNFDTLPYIFMDHENYHFVLGSMVSSVIQAISRTHNLSMACDKEGLWRYFENDSSSILTLRCYPSLLYPLWEKCICPVIIMHNMGLE